MCLFNFVCILLVILYSYEYEIKMMNYQGVLIKSENPCCWLLVHSMLSKKRDLRSTGLFSNFRDVDDTSWCHLVGDIGRE
jgi:hypothetical protein